MKKFKISKRGALISLKDVFPNIKNPRRGHYERRKLDELKDSLNSLGQITAIKIDENGIILAGHRRYQAAKELEWDNIRADVKIGLSEFDKSAMLISDNATQQRFNAWDNRKAIADIYLNEFCEVYDFKSFKDKGYTEFAKRLGISSQQARRCIDSMAKVNLNIAKEMESAGCTPDLFDEVLDSPEKYRIELKNKAIALIKERKAKINTRTKLPMKRSKDVFIKDSLRMFKKSLSARNSRIDLQPSYFAVIYRRLNSLGEVLTKDVIDRATPNQKLRLKKEIKQNIIRAYKQL